MLQMLISLVPSGLGTSLPEVNRGFRLFVIHERKDSFEQLDTNFQ